MDSTIRNVFAGLEDPRRITSAKLHLFHDILFTICAALVSGMDDWVKIETFAVEKEAWLRRYCELPGGIPTLDTMSRVLGRIKPEAFAACLTRWAADVLPSLAGVHIAVDGKTLRGSLHDDMSTHIVTAYAGEQRLVLAQHAVVGKGHELSGIRAVLGMLDLRGAVVTIDALGAQKDVVAQIRAGHGDYVIALKGNQRNLFEDGAMHLDAAIAHGDIACHETSDDGHGRRERRRAWLVAAPQWMIAREEWRGLASIGMVESRRTVKGKVSSEQRYFLTSLADTVPFAEAVRSHWSIENGQHWVLDVAFGEDGNRSRKDFRAANLAALRRHTLNLVRLGSVGRRSLTHDRIAALLRDERREQLLFGQAGC